MVESARMPPLRQLMDTIRGPILVARHHVLSDSTASEGVICDEHSVILDAIRQGNVWTAQERMELHMNNDVFATDIYRTWSPVTFEESGPRRCRMAAGPFSSREGEAC
jgi:hypothetical protein